MRDLVRAAFQVQKVLDQRRWKYCFIGGIAVQKWGQVRFTDDIDLALFTGFGNEELYIDKLLASFDARIPNPRGFALQNRVLLLADLGVVEIDDPRFASTVSAMERELMREKHVMRYASEDDFGLPVTAFLICRFWLIDALWSLGRKDAARDLFTDALAHRNRYGLLSEDVDPQTGVLWGNFPQTYSMAGLILSAMWLSRSWEDRYWRG